MAWNGVKTCSLLLLIPRLVAVDVSDVKIVNWLVYRYLLTISHHFKCKESDKVAVVSGSPCLDSGM